MENESTLHVCARYILYIRNYNNYTGYKSNTGICYLLTY